MALSVVAQGVRVGTRSTFAFDAASGGIGGYVVGIQYFDFQFLPGQDHPIELITLQVQTNQLGQQSLTVGVTGVMQDASGHNLDPGSLADVAVVAWQGQNPNNNVLMAQAFGIADGQQTPFNPGAENGPVTTSLALMSGFSMSYDDSGGDHNVQALSVAAGQVYLAGTGEWAITSSVTMKDGSGHVAVNPTMDGGYLGVIAPANFELQPWSGPGDMAPASVEFTKAVSSATFLMQGFSLNFPDGQDHWVSRLAAGGSLVTVTDDGLGQFQVYCGLNDTSGHTAVGTVQGTVLGIYS